MIKHFLIFVLMSSTCAAETNLFIPLGTIHTRPHYYEHETTLSMEDGLPVPQITTTAHRYNSQTFGIGIEHTSMDTIYALSINKNSYYETSTYASVGYAYFGAVTYSTSLVAATGYGSSIRYFPVFSAKYKSFRLTTTYPFANATCGDDLKECDDFFNVQYVININ